MAKDRFLSRLAGSSGPRSSPGRPATGQSSGDAQRFVEGERVSIDSTWVARAQYDFFTQELTLTFKDGFEATYEGVPEDVARQFYAAESKGQFVHDTLLGDGYMRGQPSTAAYPWH